MLKKQITNLINHRQVLNHFGMQPSEVCTLMVEENETVNSYEIKDFRVLKQELDSITFIQYERNHPPRYPVRRPTPVYWDSLDQETGIYFVQYNRCTNRVIERLRGNKEYANSMPSFKEFRARVLENLESGSVQRLIFDMRYNGGGNSIQGTQLVKAIADIEAF